MGRPHLPNASFLSPAKELKSCGLCMPDSQMRYDTPPVPSDLVHCFPFLNRRIYLLLTKPTSYEKEMQRLRKLLDKVESDEDSDFSNEDNGPEDILEENFSDHESFSEHDTESEEDGYPGNEEVNNSEWFSSKDDE
ncbi:hypothetical protein AVEN_137462-1 [Araneus ventricosus]|uniref:Uncharacterized protein n=1 Tax=Araneus ventricosus TaxID=182803 RepID=A0A4Y2LV76_ARAVE|nr:hypothetical protein AVEN_137462-1 [Araneus ventricosus]